jgi:hypothetical protein
MSEINGEKHAFIDEGGISVYRDNRREGVDQEP